MLLKLTVFQRSVVIGEYLTVIYCILSFPRRRKSTAAFEKMDTRSPLSRDKFTTAKAGADMTVSVDQFE
jgi:hypothetical protein